MVDYLTLLHSRTNRYESDRFYIEPETGILRSVKKIARKQKAAKQP